MARECRFVNTWGIGSEENPSYKEDIYGLLSSAGSFRTGASSGYGFGNFDLRGYLIHLGYDRPSLSNWPSIGATIVYEDGSTRSVSGPAEYNGSIAVDYYIEIPDSFEITFSAYVGDEIFPTEGFTHTINIENNTGSPIRLRNLAEFHDFFLALGYPNYQGEFDNPGYRQTPAPQSVYCEDDNDPSVSSTNIIIPAGFGATTITHEIPASSDVNGGDELPDLQEQVEENEGDIFVLNNEVDDLQAGIYQLRRDNVDQDAYWEEVYVRVRDFSGRVRDEVQDLRDFVNAQPAFWDQTINAINNNVRAAQGAAANAESAVFGLTGQLQALQDRITALENK